MTTANVTVMYVNDPQPGYSYGNIKTKELGYVSVKPADLKQFQRGQSYQIEYAVRSVNGRDYKNFVRLVSSAPAQHGTGGAGTPLVDEKTARQIFVTGVVGRAMGSGKFAINEIPALALEANEAWEALKDAATQQQQPDAEQPEDEIPF